MGCTSTTNVQNSTLTGTLTIHGTTALTPTLLEQAQAFTTQNPDVKINITTSATGEAISYIINGQSDIAPTVRVPTAAEYTQATNAGKSLHITAVGYDAVAIIVPLQNPIVNISSAQIKGIFFDGTITNWSQIPGSGMTGPINIYYEDPKASSTASFLSTQIANGEPFTASATLIPGTDLDLLPQKLSDDPNGISYTSTAYISSNVKALPVDGVLPTSATILDNTYSLSRKLYMITNGEPAGLANEFITFMFSREGRQIATDNGIVPVS
jgi:phosphate transport system substrate-binding protein